MGSQCKCAECESLRNSNALVIAVLDFSHFEMGSVGLAVMLDKPIILLRTPGLKVPDKIAKVVDRFVELSPGMTAGQIMEAVYAALIDMGIVPDTGTVRGDIEPSQN